MASAQSDLLSSLFGLSGKSLIITGGNGGLGSAIALALAQAGASPIVSIELPNDPLSSEFKKKLTVVGAEVIAFQCDLSNGKALRQTYHKIWEKGIVPDLLVNCAGYNQRNRCEDATEEEIEMHLDVNVKSYYISTQEFGRRLLSLSRPGKVINICSVTAFNAGFNTSVYSTTKGAVLQMTKAFSNEWSARGIQVNCIAPGFMNTAMTAVYQNNQTMVDYLMLRVPMGRWGEPEDLRTAALYLMAPGSGFVTGSCVVVDGGFCGK